MAVTYLSGGRIQGELGKEWIISETANAGNVEITGGELEINSLGNASNNGSLAYVDLGASVVSSTEWILRWKWHFTSFSGNGSAPNTINVGLSSGKDGAGSAGNNQGNWSPTENIAMIFMSGDASDTYFQQVNGTSANNVYDGSNTSRTNLVQGVSFSNTTYYMQLRRYSNSGTDTIEASYGTNSDYTTGRTTSTRTANMPTSLQYIKAEVWHHDTSGTTTNCHSEIDDVKFWNGTSTSGTPTYQTDFALNPPDDKATVTDVPVGTRFEETDTLTIYRRLGDSTTYTQTSLDNASNPSNADMVAEMVVNTSSLLYNKQITNVQYYLYNPSSATGTVTCALRRIDGTLVHTFWTKDISTLPATAGTLTSETTTPYTGLTKVNDCIAISTNSATTIAMQIDLNSRPFDGANTAWALKIGSADFTDAPYSGAYYGDCGFSITANPTWVAKGTA